MPSATVCSQQAACWSGSWALQKSVGRKVVVQVLSVAPRSATLSAQHRSWSAAGRLPQASHESSAVPAASLAPQQDWTSASAGSEAQSSASSSPRPAVSGRAAAAVLRREGEVGEGRGGVSEYAYGMRVRERADAAASSADPRDTKGAWRKVHGWWDQAPHQLGACMRMRSGQRQLAGPLLGCLYQALHLCL